MITQKQLKELLTYNSDTGKFIYNHNTYRNQIKTGSIAGGINTDGYIRIRIEKKYYPAHRLAWLYVYGTWPKGQIDHINGIRNDNRIENLRDVTIRENQQNRLEHRRGNLVGAHFKKTHKKWLACIRINRKLIYLGYYNTQQEAHEVYLNKLKEIL